MADDVAVARCMKDFIDCLQEVLEDTSHIFWFVYVDEFLTDNGYDHRQAVKVLCHGEVTNCTREKSSPGEIAFTMAMKQTESVYLLHLRCFFNVSKNVIRVCDAFHADQLLP